MKYKNNPFNIRSGSRWLGLTGTKNGFCEFDTLEHGVRAACVLLLQSYRKKGVCRVVSIISRFAPSSENNTGEYLRYITTYTGLSSDLILVTTLEYVKLLQAMAWFESHFRIDKSYLFDLIRKFDIKLF